MLYDEYLTQAELQRWILDADVAWTRIRSGARARPAGLARSDPRRGADRVCTSPSTRRGSSARSGIRSTSRRSSPCSSTSRYKHFYVLNRYLDLVGYRPIGDDELIEIRKRNLDTVVSDPIRELARYMISEHFAAYFFLRLSRLAQEPVLRDIAGFIAKDEFRHTQFAFDLLQTRVNERADYRDRILEEGLSFRHVGADVVTDVPISEKNDLGAILTLNRKMRRLCGASLSDFAKGQLNAGY